MKVALTGASGFLGGAIARRLAERGDAVIRLGRQETADDRTATAALAGADALVHCAGVYEVGIPLSRRHVLHEGNVELTARLDEENNIEWARRLEEAGIHVGYGDPARKIHSKITLVVREEIDGVVMYAHIGTGNYNSRTARVYTDLGLFTADPIICGDLLRVFNYLTGLSAGLDTHELLVAPANLRTSLERRVEREIAIAQSGKPARLVLKMNALEDLDFTRLLYRAGQAGVQVDLIVRGICRLRPGVPGLSENVRVVSVIGRFLEHSRVFYFQNDGAPEVFIGSADLMKRNLDERIEVLTPVHRPALQHTLLTMLEMLLADRRQAWDLHDRVWLRDPEASGPGVHARLMAAASAGPSVAS